ncbi:hypothetical protein [Primorskyibacter sp. S187A]|uniref:hypothetical protein n=1 Tax=Primorskyibacter sp. S187A TaxID=3415130 RepID=UPI003C7A668B
MSSVFTELQKRYQKRASYLRTVDALRNMPVDVALDLDIYPGDAEKIAYKAVYGE